MKDVKYLIGQDNIETTPISVYCDAVCEFLNELSQNILKSPYSREYPDLSAVAFWARKGNIQKLKEQFGQNAHKIGRGLCFHITPSNIPINFAFSFFFSLLAGNSNIVRVSSKSFPQVDILINIIKNVLKNYPEIEKRNAFVKYDRNNDITAEFSKISDARMIWGGDSTISILKKMDTKPRCVDIAFADRYSVCIIDAKKINEANNEQLEKLANNFYNDTYLMDQNACSSPQLIYWLNDDKNAREKFWNLVLKQVKNKYNLQDALCVDKYTKFCENAIDFDELIGDTTNIENLLYRSELKIINKNVESLRGKGGYFYEYSIKNIEEFFNIVDEKYQTVTYFGIDPEDFAKEVILQNLKGVDRIVPIGNAMDINVMWDGHNLVSELSRNVTFQ